MRPFAVLTLLLLATAAAAAEPPEDSPAARRKELGRLQRECFRKPLLARADLRTAGPAPKADRLTELQDGSYYAHHDSGVAIEELGPVMILRAVLRQGGKRLLVTLGPPSDIRPLHLRGPMAPEINVEVFAAVDVEAEGGVREALASLVYLPGETPDDETVARCLARYPEQAEPVARMRCGQPKELRP